MICEIWLGQIVALLAPYVDRLEQLPERASSIFNYDAKAALAAPDNAEVLGWPNTGCRIRQIHRARLWRTNRPVQVN